MKLYTICSSCMNKIHIKSYAQTRPDLQMEKNDEFSVNCLSCGNIESKHVNDVRAESNKVIVLVGFIIGVVTAIVLWTYYGAIASLSLLIPILFGQDQMRKVKGFNTYMIKRKTK